MKSLEQVREQLSTGAFDFSRHALHRVVERDISSLEIQEAGADAEIIEEYPRDKYSQALSCSDLLQMDGRFIFMYPWP